METISRETGLEPVDPWYVTGFLEGEGSLTYSRSGRQLAVYLALKVAARDQPIVLLLQAFFDGIGKIYRIPRQEATQPHRGSCYYRICRHDELARVVDHLDRYPLRGSKAGAYAIWREMVLLKRNFREAPRDRLEELALALTKANAAPSAPRGLPRTSTPPSGEAS